VVRICRAVAHAIGLIRASLGGLYQLAAGGTAVGTGLNAPIGFATDIVEEIAARTELPFISAPNKFAAQGSSDAMVAAHAALRGLAVALMKIANDMRWLASGPRCGLNELVLPATRPVRPSCQARTIQRRQQRSRRVSSPRDDSTR